jgi:hypothetical protein
VLNNADGLSIRLCLLIRLHLITAYTTQAKVFPLSSLLQISMSLDVVWEVGVTLTFLC